MLDNVKLKVWVKQNLYCTLELSAFYLSNEWRTKLNYNFSPKLEHHKTHPTSSYIHVCANGAPTQGVKLDDDTMYNLYSSISRKSILQKMQHWKLRRVLLWKTLQSGQVMTTSKFSSLERLVLLKNKPPWLQSTRRRLVITGWSMNILRLAIYI